MSNDLPFVGPLIEGSYFLEPEELFGMKFALMHEGWPIPLKFYANFPVVDHPVQGKKYQIIYTGYRPIDTFILHKYFSSMKYYHYSPDYSKVQVSALISQINMNKNPEKRPFVGMRPLISSNFLTFDSKFENGNLDRVVVISEKEYDLYIRSDTNASKRFSWFFFVIGNCRGKGTVRFNVVNMTDAPGLYSLGMKPVQSTDKVNWDSYSIHNVEYTISKLNECLKFRARTNYYMLSFDITFGENDKHWVARSIPYSYSQFLKFLASASASSYFKHKQLCKSIGGLHVPKVTITDFEVSKKEKKYVLIAGRFNPGESCSSYVIEGIIKHLIGDSPEASETRKNLIFKIIPMCNPEGVVIGNSRSTVTGISLHQKYSEFTEIFATEPKYLKKLAYRLHSKLGIHFYLEVTGSFTNIGSYFHSPVSYKNDKNILSCQYISEFLIRKSDFARVFPNNSSTSSSAFPMKNTLEKDLRISTFVSENSIFGYMNDKGLYLSIDANLLRTHGSIIAESIYYHYELSKQDPAGALKFAFSTMKSVRHDRSESDSLESEVDEDALDISIVLEKTRKSKILKNEYKMHASSDDEDLQSKDYLLESFQEFCSAISNKKSKKKPTNVVNIGTLKEFYIDNTVNSNKMMVIRKKSVKPERKSANQSVSINTINFSKCCVGYKSASVIKTEIKPPILIQRVIKKKPQSPEEALEDIKLKFSQTTFHHNSKKSSLPSFHKFGPFPNFDQIKKMKLKSLLEL